MYKESELLEIILKGNESHKAHMIRDEKYPLLKMIKEKILRKPWLRLQEVHLVKNIRVLMGMNAQSLLRNEQDRNKFAEIADKLH